MAIQELANNSFAGGLGRSSGDALSGSLQALIEHKTNKMLETKEKEKKSKEKKSYSDLGLPEHIADAVSNLDPENKKEFFKKYVEDPQYFNQLYAQQSPQQQPQSIQQQGSQGQQQTAPQQEEQPFSLESITPEQKEELKAYLGTPEASKDHSPQDLAKLQNYLMGEQGAEVPQDMIKPKMAKAQIAKPVAAEETKTTKSELDKFEPELETKAEQKAIDKETLPFWNEISKQKGSVRGSRDRLNKMKGLIDKGDLSNPLWSSFVKSVGEHGLLGKGYLQYDLRSLLTTDAQEFDKIAKDFVREAKPIFGNRLTDQDLTTFLEMIPSLAQSDEAKKRVIENMNHFLDATEIRYDVAKQILKKNDGKRPANFESLVDEISGTSLDKLSEDFKNNLHENEKKEPGLAVGARLYRPF